MGLPLTNRETNIQEEEQKFFTFLRKPYPYIPPESDFADNFDPDKILVISDPHSPFENWKVLNAAKKEQHDAGTLIVPGDVGDYYSKSRFKKTRVISFADEVRAVFELVEWMSTNWRDVRLMIGNHDNRPEKTIGALFEGNVDLLIMTEQNLLRRIASYFPNVQVVGTQLDSRDFILTHIYQFGDIIFTHGELSRVQKTAVLEYISKYLFRWGQILDLKPYQIIAQAHNHTDMKTWMGSEGWFQLPTACDPYSPGMEYIFSSRMGGQPPVVGYSVFYQHDGVTDYNRSHNIKVGYTA